MTIILVRLQDLRNHFLRYAPGEAELDAIGYPVRRPVARLVERCNLIASREFRERFGLHWTNMPEAVSLVRQGGIY